MSALTNKAAKAYWHIMFSSKLTPRQRWKKADHLIRYMKRYPGRDPPAIWA